MIQIVFILRIIFILATGVTIWETLSFGERPYSKYKAEDVSTFLEALKSGEKLEPPDICSVEVKKLMYNCWFLKPDSRPMFKELADELAKMARDPGRFLVIQGDRHMKLPSYSVQVSNIINYGQRKIDTNNLI